MALMDDMIQYLSFCEDMIYEMSDTKSSDYKHGVIEGLQMAMDMCRGYLECYPEFVDPRDKYKKFKM